MYDHVCSATDTSQNTEILFAESCVIILSRKLITKALIRLCVHTGKFV